MTQINLLSTPTRPKGQLLKWVGNKYRYAGEIVSAFPVEYSRYIEPFVGTGAILASLDPREAIAGDALAPLIEFWKLVKEDPQKVVDYYEDVIAQFNDNRKLVYDEVKDRYNESPNPLDMLILSRTCYGGVMRFTLKGKISTPIGPHKPIPASAFAQRAYEWHNRVQSTTFLNESFETTMSYSSDGDLIYCDPPYVDSQAILYGSQEFRLERLLEMITECKEKGAKIALSIDGKKKSGKKNIRLDIPEGLFEREIFVDCGSSMLRRFQNGGRDMNGEGVHERLLLTW